MTKNVIIKSLGIILLGILLVILQKRSGEVIEVSSYDLLSPQNYDLVSEKRSMYGLLKSTDGRDLTVQNFKDNHFQILAVLENNAIMIEKEWITDKLASIMYFPEPNVIYAFGQDKPINIMFGAPASESNDPYDSPLYIGYFDGTCEYPAEFDYVRSKKKCSQYLQDTLDFVGFDTVDEMLEYSFGDYITKDNSEVEDD